MDDYGSESYAELAINHKNPSDVKAEEFDYYGWVYPFVEPQDLLFYLYPIIVVYSENQHLDSIDSFMYSMDSEITQLLESLSKQEIEVLKQALLLIWNIGEDDYADWWQCENLQKLIGLL